ncbi:hypothetical protein KW797_00255 [Candidatus Parcubacteria bacterium]|nr:hypothetical protein [Candidatus Parcubacteria bacterium]
MNYPDLTIVIAALEANPEARKVAWIKEQARDLVSVRQISADTYSQILARLARMQKTVDD